MPVAAAAAPSPTMDDVTIPSPTISFLSHRSADADSGLFAPPPPPPAPAPQYQRTGDIWSQWATADRAAKTVLDSQIALADLESVVKGMKSESSKLQENSSNLFKKIHKSRHRSVHLSFKPAPSASESEATARHEFETAHKQETAWLSQIEGYNARIKNLKDTVEMYKETAGKIDEVYEMLGASVVGNIATSETGTRLEVELAAASGAYDEAQTLVANFQRARVTVQHAHHYYTMALKTIDAVRGTSFGRALIGGLGEVSKQRDYRDAMETAHKANVCYAETVRVLTPHIERLPPAVKDEFDVLKEMGLLQASRIYELMYGWKSRTTGITQAVEVMLARQEDIFVKLTHVAVWVQDETPVAEAALRAAQATRDSARRALVAHWYSNSSSQHRDAVAQRGRSFDDFNEAWYADLPAFEEEVS